MQAKNVLDITKRLVLGARTIAVEKRAAKKSHCAIKRERAGWRKYSGEARGARFHDREEAERGESHAEFRSQGSAPAVE